jgi:membrane-associated protease RseP (regulator of RpoE activity)
VTTLATPEAAPEAAPTPSAPSSAWALVRLLGALALITGVFLVLGLGDLLLVLAVIIVMVMVHEFGHFATAKWSHMKVTQYFVGFGPPLWSIRRGETEYGVKPILAGGYVKIPGMTNLEEIDPVDEPRTYRQQPFHNRIIVASAGSFMHFVMAFVLAWIAVVAFGVPGSSTVKVAGFVQWPGHERNAAQLGGIHAGDTILAVNGTKVTDPSALTSAIQKSPGKPLAVEVRRDGHDTTLSVTPALGYKTTSGDESLSPVRGAKPIGIIGIESDSGTTFSPEGPFRALGTAGVDVGRITAATVAGLGHVFSPHGLSSLASQVTSSKAAQSAAANPQSSGRVMSIVGAARVATQAVQAGVLYLLEILIALNIVIGLVNMLPMLPLDGGHVAIAIYERIRTKKGQPYYQADAAKLMPVVYAFVSVLIVVVAAAVFLDIAHPVANPFH